ncbi:MAG: ATP-binding protein [Candidatus Omnitrophica bacterium]|nr:ATP-binding protein [Candidatus Omnitrophota bacterium]
MIISVASGKGGTGKTTIATNLALSIGRNVQFLDCDVEEPNAHIFIKPEIKEKYAVYIPIPQVDPSKCNLCKKCQEVCAFNAIAVLKNEVLVFPEICHGCGSCSYFCPQGAIKEIDKEIGFIEIGQKKDMKFIHGMLKVGTAIAPPIIKEIRKHADPTKTVIIDAPPGTSCPVIESISSSDFCVLVTEPTPFGLNDLILAVEVLRKLQVPFGVVINRSDLGNDDTKDFCKKENISILMEIPFKKEIASCYSKGIPIVNEFPEYKKDYQQVFKKIEKYRGSL